eukprot:374148_1
MEMQMNIKNEEIRKLNILQQQMNHLKLSPPNSTEHNGINNSSNSDMIDYIVNTLDNTGLVYTNKIDNTRTETKSETETQSETELEKEKEMMKEEEHVLQSLSYLNIEDITNTNKLIHLQILVQNEISSDHNIISKDKQENSTNSKYINKKYLGFVLLPTNLKININQCILPD